MNSDCRNIFLLPSSPAICGQFQVELQQEYRRIASRRRRGEAAIYYLMKMHMQGNVHDMTTRIMQSAMEIYTHVCVRIQH